jgi:outer membrane murein-binding lipoprotein Lpp
MVVMRSVIAMLAWCMLLGLAACATPRSSLSTSADRLEHDANALARDARDADYPTGYVHDAHVLADDARAFRHTVEDRTASRTDAKVAFERLSRSYHAVRDEVEGSDSRTARADFKPVTDAYLDIEREMGGYPEHHARAD